ncbi:RloB family protein [Pseudanabaena galeata UHCC 0370]|uniref:RloB family protein n=1 Tax=Pseudanabaena galeata UHCC 0370 TaxID=3110310 RepID=A0ABU5TN14_9CYAN|nr:RloB family protein [Pseudanabaena galeata]MEA5479554.1 RloB family protein [Pseudanabaena galeata UHCC 0370]
MATSGNLDRDFPKKSTIPRKLKDRASIQFLIIACEDQKTEPNYFKQFKELFPDKTVHIELVDKGGTDSLGVVEAAIEAVERFKSDRIIEINKNDFVWVVFDRDDAHLDIGKGKRFNEALAKAKKNEVRVEVEVAYSNEVFELWFLLHLEDVAPDISIPRNDKGAYTLAKHNNISLDTLIQKGFYDSDIGSNQSIYERLEKAIRRHTQYSNYIYVHKKEDVSKEQSIDKSTRKAIKKYLDNQEDIIKIIQDIGDELKAIERAAILLEYHRNKPEIDANPSTKVHLLVRLIRRLLNQYQLGTKKVESVENS